jgi:hypothetical protein
VVFWIHGGGWQTGDRTNVQVEPQAFADKGLVFVSTAKPEGLFLTSMQQTIVDWRFRDPATKVDGIIYTSTNAFAATTNVPTLQEIFAARTRRMSERPPGR